MKHFLPILDWLPNYNSKTFRADLIAGLTVLIMLVPQGMAYAFLAGLPPIYGLYAGLVPLFLYGILGTSRQLSIGPVAISSLLVLAGISQLAEPSSPEYIQLVILTGFLVGLFQFTLGLLRMGFLVNFLSHPVITGFTSAAAIIIAVNQLKDFLGFSIPRFSHVSETFLYAIQHLEQTNWIAVLICFGSMLTIIILRNINKSIPGALIVVVVGTLLAWSLNLEAKGLSIIKDVPEGLPTYGLPILNWETFKTLIPTVLTVAIIGIVESISIAKVIESKHSEYEINPNQELFALGISKMGGAFFQAMPTSGSFVRSAINDDTGAKTGIASVITAFAIGMTLIFLTPIFYYLPKAVLAAIILLAVKKLFNYKEAIHLWHSHRLDFVMMIITFIITLILGIEQGVLTGVVLSILAVLYRSSQPHVAVLGNLPGTTTYRNINRFDKVNKKEEILIIRFDNQLYFVNASFFKDMIKSHAKANDGILQLIILDCSSIYSIDSSGIKALKESYHYLQEKNIQLYLTCVIGPVRDTLYASRLMQEIGKENQFMKVHDAVLAHQSKNNTTSTSWSPDAVQTNILSPKDK